MARIEVPIGVLTAVVGTPCFIWLLSRAQRQT
jgi:ABC-type Fe3+-siderophore transport system permease subunit